MKVGFNTLTTRLPGIMQNLENPNLQYTTLFEEIPADIGRSVEGYKRGGILEASEKFRKEVMAAIVWLFGIPTFEKAGKFLCEKTLKLPVAIDFCNAKEGNDCLRESIEYLKTGINPENKDVSELAKYTTKAFKNKLKNTSVDSLIKQTKAAKNITTLSAWAMNCAIMGIVLPLYNQAITSKKLKKEQSQKNDSTQLNKVESFEEFKNSVKEKNQKEVAFKGLGSLIGSFPYYLENNNRVRLISTDVPMIAGRIITSRNKFEALEYLVMDGLSIYFYNFFINNIKGAFSKVTKTPNVNLKIVEKITNADDKTIEKLAKNIDKASNIKELINNETLEKEIYKIGTFGKYGKMNTFVKNKDIEKIDKSVINFVKYANEKLGGLIDKTGNIKRTELENLVKKINIKNSGFFAIGLIGSIIALSSAVPKFTFWLTKKLTGKNTFAGITDYNDSKKENC